MSSVSSVCLVYPAYDERMRNVLSIRSHTLTIFKHVQKLILVSTYNNVHRRMPSVRLTYICVYERMVIRWYADVILCSVTALLRSVDAIVI